MTDAQFYEENGYVHARGVFRERELEELRAAVDGMLGAVAGSEHDANHAWAEADKETVLKGFHNLQYHDAAFLRAVAHPPLVATLVELLGPNVQLHHTKMLVKPPERGAPFPMHQDYPYFPHERHTVLAASIHLDDADEENGCLRVVPGTHKLGPLEFHGHGHVVDEDEYPLERGTPVPARAGDVVIFNYLTVHGSGVNTSTRTRRNLLFQYRDPEDAPVLRDGLEPHVDWGLGLMVAGRNAVYWQRRPQFQLVATG